MEPTFTVDFQYTFDEYRGFNRVVKSKIFRAPLLIGLMEATLLIVAFIELELTEIDCFGCMLFVALFFPLLLFFFSRVAIKKAYRSNRLLNDLACRYGFYADHFTQESRYGNQTIPYSHLYRILETEKDFYLMNAKNQGFIVPKGGCSPELVAFLQSVKNGAGKP